jgi:type IV pilus assembly protein PilC
MPKFQYKAKNLSGKIIEGVYEATNQMAVIDMIRQKSFYHLEVKQIAERKDLNQMKIFAKIGNKDITIFCKQFAAILKAGVTLIHALNMLSDQTENKILKEVIRNVSEDIQKGSSLSQAMSQHADNFPPILIHMITAGEVSGTLENSLEVMAVHFEKAHKLQQKVKSAMTYPVVVCVVAIAVVIFLLTAVVPIFVGMFENASAELPLPTKILLGMSGFLKQNGLMLILFLVIVGVAIKMYLSSETGRLDFDKKKLAMPLIGNLQIKTIAARFARTMSTLLTTGVSITEALDITAKVVGNAYAIKAVYKIEEQVKEGKGLYIPIKTSKIFPPMLENMIMLGEESGTLERMLSNCADFYEEEVDTATQRLTSMLEPLIVVFLGFVVAFIVISIALPMFDMASLV